MKVIVLLGLPLSGKSTHARFASKDFGIPIVETGTFVYKAVEERGLEPTPENIRQVAGECKAESDSYFTEKALAFALENYKDAPSIFMSGIKAHSEVNILKSLMGERNIKLISFHASVDTRHSRLLNQDRIAESSKMEGKTVEDQAMAEDKARFNLRDAKELGYGIGELIAIADYIVNTEDRQWPRNDFEQTYQDFLVILREIAPNCCGMI